MRYKVIIETAPDVFEEVKVFTHQVSDGLLILNFERLRCHAQGMRAIPISRIHGFHTEDLD